jgi:adenine phosphoribosyltransferase
MIDLKSFIRTIPDYPHPGIQFRDVTTLLNDAEAFATAIDAMAQPHLSRDIDAVAGIEARGFILGGAVAYRLGVPFIAVRKEGKLPWHTVTETYELEYGQDAVEMHVDSAAEGHRVLVIDDLIATGGTALAATRLIERLGAEVIGLTFLVELPDLKGGERLRAMGKQVHALTAFAGE